MTTLRAPEANAAPSENEACDDLAARTFAAGRLISPRVEHRTLEHADKLSAMLACQYPMFERVLTGTWELLSNAQSTAAWKIEFKEKSRSLR